MQPIEAWAKIQTAHYTEANYQANALPTELSCLDIGHLELKKL